MSIPVPGLASARPSHFGLTARLGIIVAVLAAETVLASYFIQLAPLNTLTGAPAVLHDIQHWLFRFIIAYAISLAMLGYLRADVRAAAAATIDNAKVQWGWACVHLALVAPFVYLSARIYAGTPTAAGFVALAVAWHAFALGAGIALFAALAPLGTWRNVARQTHNLPLYAIFPGAAAVAAITVTQRLWAPAAQVTFRIVRIMLYPLLRDLHSDPGTLILGTNRFAVQIAEKCSGLEGIGLFLAFCAGWLWLFRRDYYFPRVLVIVPIGIAAVFLLNAARIAAIVLIGNAGFERVAILGFHSQAGWICFNLTAFAIAVIAQRTPWVSRVARQTRDVSPSAEGDGNPTAAFLMPLLAILAAGMISHALSAGFEYLYPLRLLAALAMLWVYRKSYAAVDLRFSWRGPAVGVAVFCLWLAAAALLVHPEGAPAELSSLPEPLRAVWIALRSIAAVGTVPLAEELAFRGYLMRRLAGPRFEAVSFSAVRWPALAGSALAFGLMHGSLWLPGIVAGLAYGALVVRTGRLGEAVAAHGTTNALLAVYVLTFDRWQLW